MFRVHTFTRETQHEEDNMEELFLLFIVFKLKLRRNETFLLFEN